MIVLDKGQAHERLLRRAAAEVGHQHRSSHWHVLRLGPEVVDRARQPFPGESIRTVDAIHLASALVARSAVPGLELLSLDERIRRTASMLGVRVQPTLVPPTP